MSTGGCLCSGVRYRIEGPVGPAAACHCSQCRRSSGHYVVGVSVPRSAIAISGSVSWYESTPGKVRRGFCPVCGSSVFWERIDGPTIDVWAGSFDAPTGIGIGAHIFMADKGDYYEIADGLPQYPAGRE